MSFIQLKVLALTQIGIDIAIVVFFIFLLLKFRFPAKKRPIDGALTAFESLLTDADKISGQFKVQLEEKQSLIKRLNEQLDKRIISLNLLLNRADVALSSQHNHGDGPNNDNPVSAVNQQAEILKLAKKGRDLDAIAETLSLPKVEVRLVLDLKQKLSQIGDEQGEP